MNFSKNQSASLNIIKKRKIKILLKDPINNECFECSNNYPEYISLNNGIFLCNKCIKNHLNLPKSVSNIIKNNLSNLTLKNIQYLYFGGNQKLSEFINTEYPNLKKYSTEYLFQTYAMDYYRKWLEYLIEGGVKPKKPDSDNAYELINISPKFEIENNKNINMIEKRKSESYMKINKIKYPKIKPIVGSKNSFRFTRSKNKYNNNNNSDNLNLTTIRHYSNTYDNDNVNYNDIIYNNTQNKLTVAGFKKKFFSLQFDNRYDIEDMDNERNNITDINEITDYNDEEDYLFNKNKKDKFDTNIKILGTDNISPTNNDNIFNHTVYSKPLYNNYLNTYNNNNSLYLNRNDNNDNNKSDDKQELMRSIDNLRNYLYKNKKRFILDLKQNTSKNFNARKNFNINNINNNIIINKNLNIYYNSKSFHKIFKKKTIGSSFSIKKRKQRVNSINNSIDNNYFYMNATMDSNLFNKNKYKNKWKKAIIENENEKNNNIEKIKVNRQQLKNKNSFINNINITTENRYLQFDNEKKNTINTNQKSKIIQRISRALKTQKEREEKRKSSEKIRVKQKEMNNDIKDNKDNKDKNDKNDKTPKGENTKININIKNKGPKCDNILKDQNQKKKKNVSIKDLINIPTSKKKNCLDLIKTNNLTNKLISPNSKRLIQIHPEPKKIIKNEFNAKTSIREMYKNKKNKNNL